MSKNKSSFDYFMQGLLFAGMLTWHDYCVEKENMQKRKEEWERDCRIKIADSASEMVDAIVNHLTGLQLNGYPPVIVEGINNLPFYAFNLVDKRNGFSVNAAQKEAKRLFKDHLFKDKEPNINIVNITENSCGEFWIELFKSMKSEKADRELIKKIVDPFSTIIAVYSLLGEINESDYEDNITMFNNALRAQYLKSKGIKDEGIDTYGVNKLKDFYEEFNGKLRYYYDASGVAAEDAPDFCEMLPLYYSGLIYNMLKRNSGLSETTKFDIYEYLYNLCCSKFEYGAKTSYELMKDADENDKENLFIVLSSLKCVDKGFLGLLCILGSKCESAGIKFDGLNEFVNLSLALDTEIEEKYPQYRLNGIGREYIVEYIRRYSEFINDYDFGKDLDIEEKNASDNSFSSETVEDKSVLSDEENIIANYNLDGNKDKEDLTQIAYNNKIERKIDYKNFKPDPEDALPDFMKHIAPRNKLKISTIFIIYIIAASLFILHGADNNVSYISKPDYSFHITVFMIFVVLAIIFRLLYRLWYVSSSRHKDKKHLHIGWTIAIFYWAIILLSGNEEGDSSASLGALMIIGDLVWFCVQISNYNDSETAAGYGFNDEEKTIIKKNKIFVYLCFLIIFAIAVALISYESYIKARPGKLVNEYCESCDIDYSYTVGQIENDNDTYTELINAAAWYKDKKKQISSWKNDGEDYLRDNGVSYKEYNDDLEAAYNEQMEKLDGCMMEYVINITDSSGETFNQRGNRIYEQLKDGSGYLASAMEYISSGNCLDAFKNAIQYGNSVSDNIVIETMYALYPDEVIKGCYEYIDEADTFISTTKAERLGYAKDFLSNVGINDSNLNSSLIYANNQAANFIPYVGMSEQYINKTSLGEAYCDSFPIIWGEDNCYYWTSGKGRIFEAYCENYKVVRVIDKRDKSTSSSSTTHSSSGKKTESTTTVDPMDHDMDTYYEDFRDEFEDEDDAWDDFEDNEEYWDEY